MAHKTEKIWKHKDNVCVVLMTDQGHRCGYVGVQKGHLLFGVGYAEETDVLAHYLEKIKDEPIGKRGMINVLCWSGKGVSPVILFNVHGGLTFSDGDGKYPIEMKDAWWFGYDCGHAGDGKDLSVVSDAVREISVMYPADGVLRSLEYCISECESLSDQLTKLTEKENEREEPSNLANTNNP